MIIRRQLKRRFVLAFFQKLPSCLVGVEACASSHHWSPELQALSHSVRLMPPAYVKPYVKCQKNDATEAICDAVTRISMRFVPTKNTRSAELPDASTRYYGANATRLIIACISWFPLPPGCGKLSLGNGGVSLGQTGKNRELPACGMAAGSPRDHT
jgi:hypothetical protein